MKIEFILPVEPKTKKNSPMFSWRKRPYNIKIGRKIVWTIPYTPFIVPSKGYNEFENEVLPFLNRVKAETGCINYPCNVKALFWVKVRRNYDLTNCNEALHDAMVKAGLLVDDNRDFIGGTDGSRVFYDKLNPRIEVTITQMDDYVQWKPTNIEQKGLFQ